MKLSFWTLGMPEWDAVQFARAAAADGYDGVDLRCEKRDGSRHIGFEVGLDATDEEIGRIRSGFVEAGVAISSLLCYNPPVHSNGVADWGRFEEELVRHAELAVRLGTPTIRVAVSDTPSETSGWAGFLDRLWQRVGVVLDGAPGLKAVAENHPGNASGKDLLAAAERAGDPRFGVEYSPDHAFVMQEDVVGLVDRFAPWIHQLCLGDRKIVEEDLAAFDGRYYTVRYESCRIGDGVVPIAAVLHRLGAAGFDGYVTLKWERAPHFGQHLPAGEIVLPEFPPYIRSLSTFPNPLTPA